MSAIEEINPLAYPGLETLATAVIVLDHAGVVRYLNPAAENLFASSRKNIVGHSLARMFEDASPVLAAIDYAKANNCSYTQHEMTLQVIGHGKLETSCIVTPGEGLLADDFLIEFNVLNQQLKIAREERLLDQSELNRELIRSLAHEIKNPLGGLRGAAQLLDRELDRPDLHEYTRVIIQEADRLQLLMDRLLTPHRVPHIVRFNIHEVLERVRNLLMAEHWTGLVIRRDYDTSLPLLTGDREQMIQAVLNIARNAAQAVHGEGEICFRTRVVRRVTIAKKMHKLAISLQIIDNGPGIPDDIRDRIFFPLVSGHENGSGLGLTLAQTFVSQHHGTVELDTEPGRTCFTLLLPIDETENTRTPDVRQDS
ncbi:MAG: nitrogen regulation protein NR(II) [Burkholderiales bacterium]|jgi:two-component system nitrogen regulation sensor histidine kinase GlnL